MLAALSNLADGWDTNNSNKLNVPEEEQMSKMIAW